ncbi:NIPSNAP family protein [Methylobacterium sp. BTF04]|uniref:NIPSNAP family protein n=1 Tax=Methylobacterium sp. BTF04 TaxID=2708300 RepID=UPI0032B29E19
MDSYAPFPFLPTIRAGERGGVYEFRTYQLKPGGLPPTLAGWEAAIEPARDYTDHLVVNMYALDGAPRITHIWGFASLEERSGLRARAYAAGVWPPKGGPEQIARATSTIALPQGRSIGNSHRGETWRRKRHHHSISRRSFARIPFRPRANRRVSCGGRSERMSWHPRSARRGGPRG